MFCPYCGTKLINDASFCHQCGAPAPSIPEREGALGDEQVGAVSPHVLDELAPQEPSARRISVRLLKRILIIAVAVIIIGAFGVAIYLAIRPTGWRVLRRCAAKYGTAKALRISADINVNFGGFGVAQRIQFKATVARPNLANVESEFSSAGMPPLRQRMISDGANLYIECDGDKDVRSAPKQFTDLPWGRMGALAIWYASARFSAKMLGKNVERFMHPLLESTTKGWFDWSDLFGNRNALAKISEARLVKRDVVNGKPVYVVDIRLSNGKQQRLYIGRRDNCLWRNEYQASLFFMTLNVIEDVKEVVFNPRISRGQFDIEEGKLKGDAQGAKRTIWKLPKRNGWVGKLIPDWAFESIKGVRASFADYRGRWLIVVFFMTDSLPCQRQLQVLNELLHSGELSQITVIAVSSEPMEKLKRFVQRHRLRTGEKFVIGRIEEVEQFHAHGITMFPLVLFVDDNGVVRIEWMGGAMNKVVAQKRILDALKRLQ